MPTVTIQVSLRDADKRRGNFVYVTNKQCTNCTKEKKCATNLIPRCYFAEKMQANIPMSCSSRNEDENYEVNIGLYGIQSLKEVVSKINKIKESFRRRNSR